MKKMIFMFLLSASFINLFGQETAVMQDTTPRTQTLFSKAKINSWGIYVAPEFTYGQYTGSFTPQLGGSVMIVLNKKFAIGGNVSSIANRNFTPTDLSSTSALQMNARTAGLRLEYSFAPHKLIHITTPLTLGIGRANADSTNIIDGEFGPFNGGRLGRNGSGFGFIQPGINVEMNLFKYAKVFVGADYRIATNVFGTNTANLSTGQLSGLGINAGLKVGLFDQSCKRKKKDQKPS